MCKELKEELEDGKKVAMLLVEHLEAMGAAKASFPIETDDGCYQVTIIKTL